MDITGFSPYPPGFLTACPLWTAHPPPPAPTYTLAGGYWEETDSPGLGTFAQCEASSPLWWGTHTTYTGGRESLCSVGSIWRTSFCMTSHWTCLCPVLWWPLFQAGLLCLYTEDGGKFPRPICHNVEKGAVAPGLVLFKVKSTTTATVNIYAS